MSNRKCFIISLVALLVLKCTALDIPKYKTVVRNQSLTSCDEFMTDAKFQKEELMNVDWMVFYRWSFSFSGSLDFPIRFASPSQQLVDRIKSLLDAGENGLSSRIRWSGAQLFMETKYGSSLLVRHGRPGRFVAVTFANEKNDYSGTPLSYLAIKNVGRYVGMMTCQTREATALAPAEELPDPTDVEAVASLMGVKGLGLSYIPPDQPTSTDPAATSSQLPPPFGFEETNMDVEY